MGVDQADGVHHGGEERPHVSEVRPLQRLEQSSSIKYFDEKLSYLKMLGEGLQVHRDVKGFIEGRHHITEHRPDKMDPFK